MGKIFIGIFIVTAGLLRDSSPGIFWFTVVIGVVNFWSLGILSNFIGEPSSRYISVVSFFNMVTSLILVALFVYALVVAF